MSFNIKNVSKFSNSKELAKLSLTDDFFIENVRFSSLKFNNDGFLSIELSFDNTGGQIKNLSKNHINIIFNVFCDDASIKYNSFEDNPLQALLQENMAVIDQSADNGIFLVLKYTSAPTLRFKNNIL